MAENFYNASGSFGNSEILRKQNGMEDEFRPYMICTLSNLVMLPSLGSVRFWLELWTKKLGSARMIFQKTRFTKNCPKRA